MDNVAVIGMGKLGLPVATQFAMSGFHVVGADINQETVEAVNSAIEPFPGEENLQESLEIVVSRGKLVATADVTEAVKQASVIVVTVPVVIDQSLSPDFRALDEVASAIGGGLNKGSLVILETTVPVGTTRSRFSTRIAQSAGMSAYSDFSVAFSPERVLTGRVFADLRKYPKIVGGIDEGSGEAAVEFYSRALQFENRADLKRPNGVWNVGSCEAAELVKLAETTYRDVNIALANTFAAYAESNGMDILSVIEAANSQSYSHIHQPGIAVGGHCIPVYPHLYLAGHPDAELVRTARSVNRDMPSHAVRKLSDALGGLAGRKVAVLGASYRTGVKETAFSGVWDVTAEIESRGGTALVHDPLFSDKELRSLGLEVFTLGQVVDGVIIQTDHEEYSSLTSDDLPKVQAIYDGRRILQVGNFPRSKVISIGDGARG